MFNKKYKKYIADTAKAFEDFINKQSDAMDGRLEEFEKQNKTLTEAVNDLNENSDGIYDYLDSKEKAELYTVCTPFDIKDLEPMAQEFLVGALFCLTKDRTPNEDQQAYLRSVMHYLNIKEPSAETKPSSIENIEDLSAQKAILQTVMEYLCLQGGDSYDETELQQEFLDAFSVNNKSRQAISEHVEQLYIATGAKGLAEKYGYVPVMDDASASEANTETPTKKELTADEAEALFNLGFYASQYRIYYHSFESVNKNVRNFIETCNYIILLLKSFYADEWTLQIVSKNNSEEITIAEHDKSLNRDIWCNQLVVSGDIVFIADEGEILCVDIPKKKYYSLFKSDYRLTLLAAEGEKAFVHIRETNEVIEVHTNKDVILYGKIGLSASDKAFFYNHELWAVSAEKDPFNVLCYSQEKQAMTSVFALQQNGFYLFDTLLYQNNLFLLLTAFNSGTMNGTKKCRVISVDLNSLANIHIVCDNIYVHGSGLWRFKKGPNGWLFIGEETKRDLKFGLYFFSCETGETTLLAQGCGEKESEYHIRTYEYMTIGDFVFFATGHDFEAGMVSIRNPQIKKTLETAHF